MIDLDSLRSAAGIGVAGNFAGHLEQAGEAADFTSVTAAADAPKGVFPWYRPGATGPLGAFPLSADRVTRPAGEEVNLQVEPEMGALCALDYGDDGTVVTVRPLWVAAFDDCSIRRPGAAKISDKKNWGPASKGVASRVFPVGDLEAAGALASLRIASFLRRGGVAHDYGVDSPARGYSYAGRRLLDWIADRLVHQTGAADTPLEPVGEYLRHDGRPRHALIGVGATRYTALGESTYLEVGDTAIVIVYDEAVTSPERVRAAVAAGREHALPAASVLSRRVVPA